MKIVNRKEFLSLPNGVLFRKYSPCIFEDLQIKTSSNENDFVCISFDWVDAEDEYEALESSQEKGESFQFSYDTTYRDGLYDDDQLFAFYEKADVEKLIETLSDTLKDYPSV